MNITINSRKLGQPVDFYRPGRSYIFVDLSGDGSKPGTLGRQICEGGKLIGRTISYSGENKAVFARICRGWFRAYLRCVFQYKCSYFPGTLPGRKQGSL